MDNMNGACKCGALMVIAKVLTIVGGINWGLVGIFQYNLVNSLLGTWPMVERVVYGVVGVAALVLLFGLIKKLSSGCCSVQK